MSRVTVVKSSDGSTWGVSFICPGCHGVHRLPTPPTANAWEFNGNLERPTLTPSILVYRGTRFADAHDPESTATEPQPRCHSFVTDGRIAFCSDSEHALAVQTVDLPEIA